jgi:hypothetical protein
MQKPKASRVLAFVTRPLRGTELSVTEAYEIRCGSRSLARRDATTPEHELIDYLRSLGCRDADVVRVAPDGVSWRGAVYTAAPLPTSSDARDPLSSGERG